MQHLKNSEKSFYKMWIVLIKYYKVGKKMWKDCKIRNENEKIYDERVEVNL